ncbi:MAG: hypothetical protein JXR88_16870 [Clostridia bacterium]|nr:hypothetical protein [Clostridia bacterium]
MTTFFKSLIKLTKRNSKSYPNSDHLLTKSEKQNLAIAFTILITPIIIGLSIYLIG